MSGVSDKTFSFTWKIENIHLSNLKMGQYFSTPTFRVGLLENTMFQLLLAPAGIQDPLYMGCSLSRISSSREMHEPKVVLFTWRISLIAEGGSVRFEKYVDCVLKPQKTEELPQFIPKSELVSSDMPRNSLTIYFQITKAAPYILGEVRDDLDALSSDLRDLLESGFRSDFTMYCRGEIFKVHKFILLSRWPGFCERLEIDDISTRHDIIMTGIGADTLKALLTFIYTGKLQRKDISMELCSYMYEQYCDDLMKSLVTPESNLEFVTRMHHEKKTIIWEVGDDDVWKTCKTPFFRVIPLEEVYGGEMVIIFSFEKTDGEEWLKLVADFTGFTVLAPLLLDGELSFINKGAVVRSLKFTHLVESRDEWCFPQLVKKHELLPNERNSKCVEIRLCICDGCLPTRQVCSNVNNVSNFGEIKDLRKLMMDFRLSSYEADLGLKIGERVISCHLPLIAARSAEFRKLIQANDKLIEIKEYLTENAANSFVSYLYGVSLNELDNTDYTLLYIVAKKYSLAPLQKIIKGLLENTENFEGSIFYS